MSNLFEERERGYEAKWAHDEELHFKIMSLRNSRLARWAAELMRLPQEEHASYVKSVIEAGMSGKESDPVFFKIAKDLAARQVAYQDSALRNKMKEFYDQAEHELISH